MIIKQWFARAKAKAGSISRIALNKLKNLKIKMNRKNIIIIASAAFIVLLAAAAGYYYYFYIYTGPNFDDPASNDVATASMEEVEPGGILSYEVKFKNNGYRTVDSLNIYIPIPDNVELTSYTEGAVLDEEGKVLSYSFEDIEKDASGKLSYGLEVDQPLDNNTRIDMEDIIFDYTIREENFNKTIKNDNFHIVKSSPDFSSFSITSADTNGGLLSLGDEIRYTIKIKNTGNMIAGDVIIKSSLSPFLAPVEDTISPQGRYNEGDIIWDIDQIEPGDSETFSFNAVLEEGDVDDMEEIITGAAVIYDDKEVNNGETVEIARLFPDFSESTAVFADANGGGYLWAGETINVRVTIKNTGQRKADDYQLYCPIPAQATYVSQSGTAEGIRWDDGIRGLIWDLNGLEVGGTREIVFNMTVNNDFYYRSSTISSEFHIAAGEDEFLLEPASIYVQGHPYLNVVVMGDSLIAKSDWVQRLDNKLEAAYPAADYNTSASAVSGEMSFQGLARFDSTVGPLHPTILVIAYGTNDTGISLSYFKYSITTMVGKGRNLGATVFINTVGPITSAGKEDWPKYNQAIREISAQYGVPIIDVTTPISRSIGSYLTDGMHYSSAGAETVAQAAFNSIVPYLNGLGGRR